MRFDPRAGVTDLRQDETGRRRRGRIGQESVLCDHGPVLDLSAAGMRIACRRVPRGDFTTRIHGLGIQLTVRCRVAWSKKAGFFRREVGIEFVDMNPKTAEQITRLGMINRDRCLVAHRDAG
jgi:hypothetical protein